MTTLADLVSMLLGGLSAGMVLFIVSVGLSITMGLMGVVNLAHGGFAMLGGYVIAKVMLVWGVPFVAALGIGFAAIALFSIVLERLLYVHFYKATELDQVLFTIGLLFVMTASVTLLFGPASQHIELPPWLQGQVSLGFLQYRTYSLFLIVCGCCIAGLLVLGFERTRFGSEIRAAVDNRRMAESMGVDVSRLFTVTFALGSGLAALGGGLGAEFLGLDAQYPFKYLVYFLIVVAIGAGRQISGVFYASLLIGILDFALKKYVPRGGALFIFGLTIILLLWRPKGLFSRGAR
jgi:branched-chain amino acid transport system permease protein